MCVRERASERERAREREREKEREQTLRYHAQRVALLSILIILAFNTSGAYILHLHLRIISYLALKAVYSNFLLVKDSILLT